MKLFSICLLLFCKTAYCQPTPITFEDVVTVDSVTKDQLFERARLWFNDNFRSSKAVLEISDKESGELVGKPILSTWFNYRFMGKNHKVLLRMPVTLSVRVKDGKYKYRIYDITTQNDPQSPATFSFSKEVFGDMTNSEVCPYSYDMVSKSKADSGWNESKANAKAEILKLIESLKLEMSKNTKEDF